METVLRAAIIYGFLMVVFRVAGKRTFSDLTPFEFVLLLVIGEATQQALLAEDFSITNAFIAITTLILMDIALSLIKQRIPVTERYLEGLPVLLVENGELIQEHLDKTRVDESDILEAARQSQGLENTEQIKYAVLEKSGGITIIRRQA